MALAASIFPKYDARMPYLVYRVWMRHLHYTHNLAGDPPPPVDKSSKKMSPSTVLVNMTKKSFQPGRLAIGLPR